MEQAKLKTRSEIPEQYKWHLEDIFPSNQAWEEEFLKAEKLLERAESFQGHLGDSAEALLTCFDWMDEVGQSVGEIYTYARMRRDEDNRNAHYQALTDRAGALSVRVGSALAFVVPEILALPEGRLQEFRQANEKMALYDHALEDILRKREHVLSSQEEKLLAEMGEIAEGPSTIFGMANNADLKFPSIKNEQDEEVELTKGNYIQFMESENRRVRQEAFETLYGTYQKQINTWAAILNSNIKGDVFFARARRYPSAIEASLHDDKVPLGVYDALIDTVREFLPEMHRYVKLRKKALGLDELHMYDIYVPIVSEVKMTIPYQEAVAMCREGLKPLGSDYGKVLEEGFTSHWIDVYENQGKTSGAYSWGTYRSHPYVLLNHQDTLDSMFTIAHEMGHSLHTYFSNRTQPHIYAGYKIFVA
ncbi:MAG: M3 family oligoendopeptidase, partial [Desulfitobacterium hafniense]